MHSKQSSTEIRRARLYDDDEADRGALKVVVKVVLVVGGVGFLLLVILVAIVLPIVQTGRKNLTEHYQQQKEKEAAIQATAELETRRLEREAEMRAQKEQERKEAIAKKREEALQPIAEARRKNEAARSEQMRLQQEKQEERRRQQAARAENVELAERAKTYLSKWLWNLREITADEFLVPQAEDTSDELSWRVHLLPILGYTELYDRFRLSEPWDSPHNISLLEEMPAPLQHSMDQKGQTRIRSFLPLDGPESNRLRAGEITDGLQNTALAVIVNGDHAVPWTRPDCLDPLPIPFATKLLSSSDSKAGFVFWCDGEFSSLDRTKESDLTAIMTPSAGELWARAQPSHQLLVINSIETTQSLSTESPSLESIKQSMEQIAGAYRQFIAKAAQDRKFATTVDRSPLSWRVHLLPFLGEEDLYQQFNLLQPWDNPSNLKLVAKMPSVFQTGTHQGRTSFCLLDTNPSSSSRPRQVKLPLAVDITDAPETTALFFLAAPHRSSLWTAPDGLLEVSDSSPHLSLGWNKSVPLLTATAAGDVLELPPQLHETKWKALLSLQGSERFDVTKALQSPESPLEREFVSAPPTPIQGTVEMPAIAFNRDSSPESSVVQATEELVKLREVGLAIQRYYSVHRRSPLHAASPSGKPSSLSWRVHLLPWLGHENLYKKFNLDEPWDSETNSPLLKFIPECYLTSTESIGETRICAITGSSGLLSARDAMNCSDTISHTAMLVHVPRQMAVPWTKPEDVDFSSIADAKALSEDNKSVQLLLGDGKPLLYSCELPDAVLKALLTHDGGELVDSGTVRRASAFLRGEANVLQADQDRWEAEQLKQILMAVKNYGDTYGTLPPDKSNEAMRVSSGAYNLSWRVHLLPFLGYKSLYKQFRLEESWDSPHNIQLLPLMPDCFRGPHDSTDTSTTRIVTISGVETLFPERGRALGVKDIKDGLSNTIFLLQAPDSVQVPWTKPDDITLLPDDLEPLDQLRSSFGLKVGFCDGSIRTLPPETSSAALKALITPNGGEIQNSNE